MEEYKEKDGTMTMESPTNDKTLQEKYDELKKFTEGLVNEMNKQKSQEQKIEEERNLFMMYKRMDYLFHIMGMSEKFDKDFIKKCENEIVQVLNFDNDDETK